MTATATKQATDIHQPSRKESTEVAGVGVPMMTTSRAMPRTPPICRVLDATADAVAYRPPGTAARVALPSSGRVMPTPIPLSTWPGSHWVRKAGVVPTWVAYQT